MLFDYFKTLFSIDKNSINPYHHYDNGSFSLNSDDWDSLYTRIFRSSNLFFSHSTLFASVYALVCVWKRESSGGKNEYSKRNSSPIPRLCVAGAAGGIEKRRAVSSSFDSLNGQIYSFPLIVFFLTLLLFL